MPSVINRALFVSLVLSSGLTTSAMAQKLEFNSSGTQTQLIELYTSQGCSSCPPAENLLSKQLGNKKLWEEIIPIAFHVDYWDYLGWKDIYSKASFSERQRRHYQLRNVSSVYTPGFVVDGKEWRGFFRGLDFPDTQAAGGSLTLNWDSDTQHAKASYQSKAKQAKYCYFAVLGFDQSVAIQGGENRGLKLAQNFVALQVQKKSIKTEAGNGQCQTTLEIAAQSAVAAPPHSRAIVSWVTDGAERPLQATGGWL
ncbi:MAG: DUF1223 domain-containing protein [Oceanospirillaceae bacterium]